MRKWSLWKDCASPHSCSVAMLGSNPNRPVLEPTSPPTVLASSEPPPSSPNLSHSIAFSWPLSRCEAWPGRGREHIYCSWLFFPNSEAFFDQPDLFAQSGEWFCNCRNKVSFHLSAWPLPKTCFQFLEKLDLLPLLFGISVKPCSSLKKKKERKKTGFLYHLFFSH